MKRRKLTNIERYPGIDNRFVICDVCGKKFRVKDTVRITDRYNLLNSMIVCHADADKVNPQIKPIYIQEDLLVRKDYVRPEATIMTYVDQGDTLPLAPKNLTVNVDSYSNKLLLTWEGPGNVGNVHFQGYRIYRSTDPYSGEFEVLVDNTHSGATIYLDTSAEIEGVNYIYAVAIVTDIGESPWSNYAYWPYEVDVEHLIATQNGDFIVCTQDNKNIIIHNIVSFNIVLTQNDTDLAMTQYRNNLIYKKG